MKKYITVTILAFLLGMLCGKMCRPDYVKAVKGGVMRSNQWKK